MVVLKLEDLSKYYTTSSSVVMGLTNINLSFSVGEFVAITGESGSGKSTLAHVLGGILPYEAGELYVYGKPTSHYDAADWECYRRDMVGFISQNYGILAGNTVSENVESALRFSGMDADEARIKADEILKEVELTELKTRRAGKLSSGQKQRLSIARALAKPSKILIADEPTGNLDRENSEKVIKLLKKASEDRLVILITHEFDEARDVATRRIELSDGVVITDAALADAKSEKAKIETKEKKIKKRRSLSSYVTRLTLKSRPVFSAVVCLFLAFTSFITFAFLGTFIVALDDTSTRIYTEGAFYNGDPDRLVVMKTDSSDFTESEYSDILSIKYVEQLEKCGYINDISYYYRPETDYHLYHDTKNGPNYHPVLNPDDFFVTEEVAFIDTGLFVQTVPLTNEEMVKKGTLPTGIYEVLSADPQYKIGDTLRVYVRNQREWSVSDYIVMVFKVVGETDVGEGLYFSDKFAAMVYSPSMYNDPKNTIVLRDEKVILAPYNYENFDLTKYWFKTPSDADVSPEIPLEDGHVLMSEELAKKLRVKLGLGSGSCILLGTADDYIPAEYVGNYYPPHFRMILVTEAVFERFVKVEPCNQISVYIKDYAYADRVIDALADKGYVAISPFRLGSVKVDNELSAERMTTLAVCLGALILVFVLQLILLRAMFSSLNEHYRLMSNIGLTARTAYTSLAAILLIFAVIGELSGATAVAVLNNIGVKRIADVFKYLDMGSIAVLFAVHMGSVFLSIAPVISGLKKAVFSKAKRIDDIDMMDEEVA